MPQRRKHPEEHIPAASLAGGLVRDVAPEFFSCPTGHVLPHRTPFGRCSAVDCLDESDEFPDGPSGTAAMTAPASSAKPSGAEAALLAEAMAARAARLQILAVAEAPLPKMTEGPQKWVEQRLADLAPQAVVELELSLKYGTPATRREAAREILDRSGHVKGQRGVDDGKGPVILVQIGVNPYDAQKRNEKAINGPPAPPTAGPEE